MFDSKAFRKSTFQPRTAIVPVPELAAFFHDGEPAEFEVRGLTGNELARCKEAAAKRGNVELMVNVAAPFDSEAIEILKEIFGKTKELSADIVQRLEMLSIIYPDSELPTWIKLCDAYPVTFYALTNKIFELTGQGKNAEKPQPSGNPANSELS